MRTSCGPTPACSLWWSTAGTAALVPAALPGPALHDKAWEGPGARTHAERGQLASSSSAYSSSAYSSSAYISSAYSSSAYSSSACSSSSASAASAADWSQSAAGPCQPLQRCQAHIGCRQSWRAVCKGAPCRQGARHQGRRPHPAAGVNWTVITGLTPGQHREAARLPPAVAAG